jgi:hypothetical protein
VLAAIGVLSIGLLGLAALLPVGRYTLSEAAKADRSGTCGRAAMRDIIVRRMLDSNNWFPSSNSNTPILYNSSSFLIDPEGVTNGMGPTFASTANGTGSSTTTVPRLNLLAPPYNQFGNPTVQFTAAMADAVFQATDDLIITFPEDMKPAQPYGRPLNMMTTGPTPNTPQALNHEGKYSWFATVTPEINNPTRFYVSIVVCFNRNRTQSGERAVLVASFYDTASLNGANVALGGGSIQLTARQINDIPRDSPNNVAGISLKENEWVALVSAQGLCRWYRVAAVADPLPTDTMQYLTLIGPDWVSPTPGSDKLVALGQSVIGVYSTTIELDTDPLWKN